MNVISPVSTMPGGAMVAFFREQFVAIDNISEDTARRDRIIMEARASLLIEANCISERFPAFMKCGYYTSSGWTYHLVPPFTRTLNHTFPSQDAPVMVE